MGDSKALSLLLQKAMSATRADAVHDLRLGLRQQIWSAMGSPPGTSPGYERRSALALVTARRVLALWQLKYPLDSLPHELLDLAAEVRAGGDKGEARAIWQQAWSRCVELPDGDKAEQRAAAAGLAAVQALRTSIDDELFSTGGAIETLRDDQIDADDMDASVFAAAAYSDGPVWDPSSDARRRLQFWEWWLSEAVPESYSRTAR